MRIAVVFGTRPEVIKCAPIIKAARERGHDVKVIVTGQHRHLVAPLMRFFDIGTDIDLDVMLPNQTLSKLSERILSRLNENQSLTDLDYLLVQGDTTSAAMASYWAFLHKIPVGHIEAGLRTYDLAAPFPEEANRQLIGRIATLHFAPTKMAETALLRENISPETIHQVGNSSIDALEYALRRVDDPSVPAEERLDPKILEFLGEHKLVLVTAHRRESFGNAFESICHGIRSILDASEETKVVYPVHPNPNVREPVMRLLGDHPRVLLCEPLPYVGFIKLMSRADVILTDSGGIQEEGPTLKKPILVMRDQTERPEGVEAGFAKLVGTDPKRILEATLHALKSEFKVDRVNPYGDGKTSVRICTILESGESKICEEKLPAASYFAPASV
jgi:UDP-N-acetylglucosamine 2-epimerase (non-hydrolysing)